MANKIADIAFDSFVQAVIFILLGIAALGIYVVESSNTLFTYTLFGAAAIIFDAVFKLRNLRDFIFISAFIAIFLIVVFIPSNDIKDILRNLIWFVLVGAFVYLYNTQRLKIRWGRTKPGIVAFYVLGFLLIYILMTLMSYFIFNTYVLSGSASIGYYILQAVKIGGILGFGLGIGRILSINKPVKNKKGTRR